MPLFRSKKGDDTSSTRASRSNSLRSVSSAVSNGSQVSVDPSIHSTSSKGKFMGLLRSNSKLGMKESPSIDQELSSKLAISTSPRKEHNLKQAGLHRLKKKVSTIVEADGEHNSIKGSDSDSDFDDEDSDSASNLDSFDDSTDESTNEEEEVYTEEEEEEHTHAVKLKGKINQKQLAFHLSTIMGYCGMELSSNNNHLAELANEESARTYSLLDQNFKIHRLPAGLSNDDSVIGDHQIQLIDNLKFKMKKISSSKATVQSQYTCLSGGKTLYERYGVVKDVIGKGAYGLIKIIDSNPEKVPIDYDNNDQSSVLYAVKELQKRKKEPDEKFIDRVISEFVISSTLNSKHIVKTVDLMVTLPSLQENEIVGVPKFSQVMECTLGGDLFTYLTTTMDNTNKPVKLMELEEIDCFVKQIARGLRYLHLHGVAHCDLKLENILLSYKNSHQDKHQHREGSGLGSREKIVLKLSDFGKSSVIKTKWDQKEQFSPKKLGPMGSLPYIAPEEYSYSKNSYSLSKKDCWALGVIIVVLFNIRKNYYSGRRRDMLMSSEDEDGQALTYSSGYLWETTDIKHHHYTSKDQKYKDRVFDEYSKTRMIADYDSKTKEWLVKRAGKFPPIEYLFSKGESSRDSDTNSEEFDVDDKHEVEDEDELGELRRMITYKLLDIDPESRMNVENFLRSDWMTSIECCN
ncbi:protein kinase-like protein, mutant is salt and pH sensitive [Scheffersomyces xylosifermentans]|uniref:protein kinase-like protein, mutant is salt and pH sensitive n=1 Tax=Scheffersomyces xylosifermentans TaxID=1304137 RepID=UPI00315DBE6B